MTLSNVNENGWGTFRILRERMANKLDYEPPKRKPLILTPRHVLAAIIIAVVMVGIIMFLDYLGQRLGIRLLPHD